MDKISREISRRAAKLATDLLLLVYRHVDKLPPEERQRKLAAFRQALGKKH